MTLCNDSKPSWIIHTTEVFMLFYWHTRSSFHAVLLTNKILFSCYFTDKQDPLFTLFYWQTRSFIWTWSSNITGEIVCLNTSYKCACMYTHTHTHTLSLSLSTSLHKGTNTKRIIIQCWPDCPFSSCWGWILPSVVRWNSKVSVNHFWIIPQPYSTSFGATQP